MEAKMTKFLSAILISTAMIFPASALEKEWKMVVKHYDSIAETSHELMTNVTYDSGRKCHRDAYLMNINSAKGNFSNLTTSDMVRYFCIALPKQS